jgi:ABC-2 type transport system permease protein
MVVLISGVSLNVLGLLCLPVIMLVEYILALGFAMIVSATTVYFRDLEHILGIVTMVWMYMTPIMYPLDFVPDNLRAVFMLNPMTPIVVAYRDVLYYGRVPHISTLLNGFLLGMITLVLGFIIFGKLKKNFAEEL